jgi:hypothetical protein
MHCLRGCGNIILPLSETTSPGCIIKRPAAGSSTRCIPMPSAHLQATATGALDVAGLLALLPPSTFGSIALPRVVRPTYVCSPKHHVMQLSTLLSTIIWSKTRFAVRQALVKGLSSTATEPTTSRTTSAGKGSPTSSRRHDDQLRQSASHRRRSALG